MKKLLLFLLSILTLFLVACGQEETEESGTNGTDDSQLKIVTTFYPMYEFTKQIVGEEAEVEMLVHAGSDTHNYEPSAQDMAKIHNADLLVYANPEMEIWVEDILNSLEDSEVVPVMADASNDLSENEEQSVIEEENHEEASHDHSEGDHHHIIDPHTWLDPILAQEQVKEIMDAVIAADPENKAFYLENGNAFLKELENLHQLYTEELAAAENRQFLVQHAAFGYIANRYNLDQYSLAGLSTEAEADPRAMVEAINFIAEENIPVLYYNSQTNTQLAETIAEEANIEIEMLHSLESLTDKEIEAGLDYITVMENNLEALKKSIR